tara:strand:- start:135 stop:389 length:255 start_codon:yes stop_codon:yes gene_type:complete
MQSEACSNNNIVDFLEWKLIKQLERSSSAVEFEVSSALLELYLTNQINVTMKDGELLYESKELFESEEPVHIPTDPWEWVDEQV